MSFYIEGMVVFHGTGAHVCHNDHDDGPSPAENWGHGLPGPGGSRPPCRCLERAARQVSIAETKANSVMLGMEITGIF